MSPDRLLIPLDRALRTLFAPASSARPLPGDELEEGALSDAQRRESATLMRINHVGEVCAQALYQGQALTARDPHARRALERAASEEEDHLAWSAQRVAELGGRTSLLNPLWYAGAFAIGTVAGALGDRWNLGFLAETERQVESHLKSHLERLPAGDIKSRAIVEQMKADEAGHAETAVRLGARALPAPVRGAMKLAAKVMTTTAYRI